VMAPPAGLTPAIRRRSSRSGPACPLRCQRSPCTRWPGRLPAGRAATSDPPRSRVAARSCVLARPSAAP
jgi:hypothetical protein